MQSKSYAQVVPQARDTTMFLANCDPGAGGYASVCRSNVLARSCQPASALPYRLKAVAGMAKRAEWRSIGTRRSVVSSSLRPVRAECETSTAIVSH